MHSTKFFCFPCEALNLSKQSVFNTLFILLFNFYLMLFQISFFKCSFFQCMFRLQLELCLTVQKINKLVYLVFKYRYVSTVLLLQILNPCNCNLITSKNKILLTDAVCSNIKLDLIVGN